VIAIVDVCSGNLRSVERALEHVGAEVVVTRDPAVVERADKIVVPGQGTFAMFMRLLAERRLEAPLRAAIANGTPYFGICLGLQVLFEHSEEGDVAGLGVLAGKVVRLRPVDPQLKIPHMGWNQIAMRRPVAGLADGAHVYFVHSYHVVPDDPAIVALETTHGATFCSAIQHANLFACQFHPEKSQSVGLELLRAFAEAA
jgi:imidazole glycerol-phosphate synthase subunit HisH